MLSRRELIGKAAVGATAALAVSAARTAVGSTRARQAATGDPADGRDGRSDERNPAPRPAESEVVAAPAPWDLLSPLVAGGVVASGWRLADLSPVRDGSCVVTLQNERGRSHRVHLCRNDGTPQGIVYTRRLDLVVMNAGHGDVPTEEGLAQAVAALAHVVAANEGKLADRVLAELLPHAERVRQFASLDGTPSGDGKLR
jgi:hypothetical protein